MLFRRPNELIRDELETRLRMLEYQTNPAKWLVERFGEPETLFRWSQFPEYEGHVWDGTPDPFLKAIEALAAKEWVGIEAATSTGKTFFLPRLIFWFLDVFPNSLVVTTAPKKDQLKKVLWSEIDRCYPKFLKLHPNARKVSLNIRVDGRVDVAETEGHEGHEVIGFVSSVGAGEESATKFQGFHRGDMLFVLEECAGLHMAILNAIFNTTTGRNNLVVAVGNPDSQLDALHKFCQFKRTRHIIISGLDHPNVVKGHEFIKGAVTVESIQERKEEYGEESPFFKSRARGIAPTEAAGALIKHEWLEQCNVNSPKFAGVIHDTQFSSNALGIDVAQSDDGDKASLAWGRGNELRKVQEFVCPNASDLAYNVLMSTAQLRENGCIIYNTDTVHTWNVKAHNIGVDGVGVGAATLNAFKGKKWEVISLVGGQLKSVIPKQKGNTREDELEGELAYEFESLRAQMYYEFREDVRTANIRINIQDQKVLEALYKELLVILMKDNMRRMGIEDKESIKRKLGGKSPNMADSVVYWNWMRKRFYTPKLNLPFV